MFETFFAGLIAAQKHGAACGMCDFGLERMSRHNKPLPFCQILGCFVSRLTGKEPTLHELNHDEGPLHCRFLVDSRGCLFADW